MELIEDLPEDAEISFYQQGEFVDLCRTSPMTTKPVKHLSLPALQVLTGEEGEEQNAYQNLRNFFFTKKEDLEEYITRMEEAKKRDHRKLGKELGLFMMMRKVRDSRSSFRREWF